MDGKHASGWIVLALAITSCTPRPTVENLPSTQETLANAGKRLIRSHSVADLTALATRGDRVLGLLNHAERDALARGHLRFQIDREAEVFVVAPRDSVPFWVSDLGFTRAEMTVHDREIDWVVYRKSFLPGWVGLGVNGLDRKPPAHYAVCLRARDGRPVTVSGLNPSEWQETTAADGIPEPLRGTTLLRIAHDRRHATMLARGRVWKTHVVSSRKPDQVTVAFGAGRSSEIVWSWRTSPEVDRSIVRLRKHEEVVRVAFGESETIVLSDLLNDPIVRRHTVRIDGLEPATAYEYALGDGSPEGMTAWTTVRTAPRSGDVRLLYMGDPQCGLEGWGQLLATASRNNPSAAALLIAGDLVDRGNERTNWDHFFLRASGVFERLPMMPCVGNHEYLDRGPWLYRSIFTLPANGPAGVAPDLVYSFEIGDAFIGVLDSTLAVTSPTEARRQAEWLDEQLSRTRRTWKLLMFHHPLYASHTWRENLSLRDAWVPVIDRHHVDLVLQGHDHAYLRTYPLHANHRVESPSQGTLYVVAVSGDKYCDQDPRDYTEVGFTQVSTYQTIDLLASKNRLVYKAFDASGRERDGFTIEKRGGSPRVARKALSSVR